MPGISTSTSNTIVTANDAKAVRRRNFTGSFSANQHANRPTTVHNTWRRKIDHGEPSSS